MVYILTRSGHAGGTRMNSSDVSTSNSVLTQKSEGASDNLVFQLLFQPTPPFESRPYSGDHHKTSVSPLFQTPAQSRSAMRLDQVAQGFNQPSLENL